MNKVYGLIDCNNFFVSCERVFNPSLRNSPVVVLSNNDGCIVARSQEVKDIGIAMGEPYFKVKDLLEFYGVKSLSSNFSLYSDMSARVRSVLEQIVPNVEMYSIDESFLDLTSMRDIPLKAFAKDIKNRIYQYTGIPVSVGIANSKTLSKLANNIAKKNSQLMGVMDFNTITNSHKEDLFRNTDISEVWGIGSATSKKLRGVGVNSIWDFLKLSSSWIKKNLGIMSVRTQLELLGNDCNVVHKESRKSIIVSRSFKEPVKDFHKLSGIIARFVNSAGQTLREENLEAKHLSVYIRTNYKAKLEKQYSSSFEVPLLEYTNSSTVLLKDALYALRKIFKNGYGFKKAGISLHDIVPVAAQSDMFSKEPERKSLYTAVDSLNRRWGGSVKIGRELMNKGAIGSKINVSPSYTLNWQDLMIVN